MSSSAPIDAVVTSLTIIEHMAQAGGPIGVSELARSIESTKPRIFRHLRTLVDQGYATQDPATDKYFLTPRLLHVGQAIADQTGFLTVARRFMPLLRDRVSQTVSVGQIENDGVRVLDILKHRSDVEITSRPGALFDFHSSAQGKVALAFGPEELWKKVQSRKMRKLTDKTNTDIARLRNEVEAVKKRGWAVAPEEILIGINAVAAPVYDSTQVLAGTITILGSVQFLKPKPEPHFVDALLDAAKKISLQLGFREA